MQDLRSQPITILGAGAIGATVGALLTEAGYDITLVDIDAAHVRKMQVHGLHLRGIRGDRMIRVKALHADHLTGPLGVTFLCVKGHHTEAAIKRYAPLLAEDGYVLSLQNGLNEEVIAAHVGPERTVGAFVHFGADYLEPGIVLLANEQTIYVGELDGRVSPRVEALQVALSHVMPTETTTRLSGYLWGKLVYGAVAFVVSSIDAPVPNVLDNPLGLRLSRQAAQEAWRVGRTQTNRLLPIGSFDPEAFADGDDQPRLADAELMRLADSMRGTLKQHMGIWRDLAIKKRQTEVNTQVGVLCERGEAVGVPTPVNAAVLQIVREIERGERGMDWMNLHDMARLAVMNARLRLPRTGETGQLGRR